MPELLEVHTIVNLLKNRGIKCETYDPYMNPDKIFNLEKKLYLKKSFHLKAFSTIFSFKKTSL